MFSNNYKQCWIMQLKIRIKFNLMLMPDNHIVLLGYQLLRMLSAKLNIRELMMKRKYHSEKNLQRIKNNKHQTKMVKNKEMMIKLLLLPTLEKNRIKNTKLEEMNLLALLLLYKKQRRLLRLHNQSHSFKLHLRSIMNHLVTIY